jgi:hypothetical protein
MSAEEGCRKVPTKEKKSGSVGWCRFLGMSAEEGCRKVSTKEKGVWQCGLVQVDVSGHVGWGGVQNGINQRERRV